MKLNLHKVKSVAGSKGISLRKLAEVVSMSPSGFNLALEKNTLDASKLVELCNFLGIDIHETLDDVNTKVKSDKFIEERVQDLELTAEGHESVLANIDIQMSNIKSQLSEIQTKISNLQKAK